jgi:hypothetical protein
VNADLFNPDKDNIPGNPSFRKKAVGNFPLLIMAEKPPNVSLIRSLLLKLQPVPTSGAKQP